MITVLGASGFIGQRLCERLRELKVECYAPVREADLKERSLGDVIYCIGVTADFRSRPFDTVESHVCRLLDILRDCDFDSLLYLSSVRLYDQRMNSASEEDSIRVATQNPDDLYNISKAMGESLSLGSGRRTRVARLSNVYGDDFDSQNFLSTIIKEAVATKRVTLQTSEDSEKDYVSVEDVVEGLIKIATFGQQRIYNLASGTNVSNRQLIDRISLLTGCEVHIAPPARRIGFPTISIERMRNEFDFRPASVLDDIGRLIDVYRCRAEGRVES